MSGDGVMAATLLVTAVEPTLPRMRILIATSEDANGEDASSEDATTNNTTTKTLDSPHLSLSPAQSPASKESWTMVTRTLEVLWVSEPDLVVTKVMTEVWVMYVMVEVVRLVMMVGDKR